MFGKRSFQGLVQNKKATELGISPWIFELEGRKYSCYIVLKHLLKRSSSRTDSFFKGKLNRQQTWGKSQLQADFGNLIRIN